MLWTLLHQKSVCGPKLGQLDALCHHEWWMWWHHYCNIWWIHDIGLLFFIVDQDNVYETIQSCTIQGVGFSVLILDSTLYQQCGILKKARKKPRPKRFSRAMWHRITIQDVKFSMLISALFHLVWNLGWIEKISRPGLLVWFTLHLTDQLIQAVMKCIYLDWTAASSKLKTIIVYRRFTR